MSLDAGLPGASGLEIRGISGNVEGSTPLPNSNLLIGAADALSTPGNDRVLEAGIQGVADVPIEDQVVDDRVVGTAHPSTDNPVAVEDLFPGAANPDQGRAGAAIAEPPSGPDLLDAALSMLGNSENKKVQVSSPVANEGIGQPTTTVEATVPAAEAAPPSREAQAERSHMQEEFDELEMKRRSGELKTREDIQKHAELKEALGRDNRMAELQEKQKTPDGLTEEETRELLGIMEQKELTEKPQTEEDAVQEEVATLAVEIRALNGKEPTTEQYGRLFELMRRNQEAFLGQLVVEANQTVLEAIFSPKLLEQGEKLSVTQEVEDMIKQLIQLSNASETLGRLMPKLLAEIKKCKNEAQAAEEELNKAMKLEGADEQTKKKKSEAWRKFATKAQALNLAYNRLVKLEEKYDNVGPEMDKLYALVRRRLGLASFWQTMARVAWAGSRQTIRHWKTDVATWMNGTSHYYKQAVSSYS